VRSWVEPGSVPRPPVATPRSCWRPPTEAPGGASVGRRPDAPERLHARMALGCRRHDRTPPPPYPHRLGPRCGARRPIRRSATTAPASRARGDALGASAPPGRRCHVQCSPTQGGAGGREGQGRRRRNGRPRRAGGRHGRADVTGGWPRKPEGGGGGSARREKGLEERSDTQHCRSLPSSSFIASAMRGSAVAEATGGGGDTRMALMAKGGAMVGRDASACAADKGARSLKKCPSACIEFKARVSVECWRKMT